MQDAEVRVRMDTNKVCALAQFFACFALTLLVTTASVVVRISVNVHTHARHLVADNVCARVGSKASASESANPDLIVDACSYGASRHESRTNKQQTVWKDLGLWT